nr:hypothetical protein [Sporichthya sp.]
MFDEYLAQAAPDQPTFSPADYQDYVDGKPRLAGTHDFLAARNLELVTGEESDPPDARTLWG